MKSGFTLIELLIVIGIIGILATVVLVGIDPADKINAANDTKVQRDIQVLATAMESYALHNNGLYLAINQGPVYETLIASGDLKTALKQPSSPLGWGEYRIFPAGHPNFRPSVRSAGIFAVVFTLTSKKYTSQGYTCWLYCSNWGAARPVVSCVDNTFC